MTALLAITGRAGAGKSTAAGFLAEAGWTRIKFAGPLKAMMRAMYESAGLHPRDIERRIEGDLKEAPCAVLGGCTPRRAMQTLGTEWGRDLIAPDLWIEIARRAAMLAMTRGESVVIDDCRFPNEAAMVRDIGGLVLRIEGRGGIGDHQSEQDLPADIRFRNDGSPETLAGFMRYTFAGVDLA